MGVIDRPINHVEWTWDRCNPAAEQVAAELSQLLSHGHAVYVAVDSDPNPVNGSPHVTRHPLVWVRLLAASGAPTGKLRLWVTVDRWGAPGLAVKDQVAPDVDVQVVQPGPTQATLLVAHHPW